MKLVRLLACLLQYALPMAAVAVCAAGHDVLAATAPLDLYTARLALSPKTSLLLEFADGTRWPVADRPAVFLESNGAIHPAESAELSGDTLAVHFSDGSRAEFRVTHGRGFAVFRLVRLEARQPVMRFRLFQLAAPLRARHCDTVNGAVVVGNLAAVMAATPNVHAFNEQAGGERADRTGCSHEFVQVTPGKVGEHAARFAATCYGPEQSPSRSSVVPAVTLPSGEYSATFGSREPLKAPVRVRITLQSPERMELPNG